MSDVFLEPADEEVFHLFAGVVFLVRDGRGLQQPHEASKTLGPAVVRRG